MHRVLQLTSDGSHTIAIPEHNITYHSHHGAIQESMHVFIQAGLAPLWQSVPGHTVIRILEIGFGTGLNALLTLREAESRQHKVQYTTLEKYLLTQTEVQQLNHGALLDMQDPFLRLHSADWEKEITINPFFTLQKIQCALPAPITTAPVHCIFFDAFAPDIQPELWSQSFFEQLFRLLLPGGSLVTYSSKSSVRKALSAAGFTLEKIPGPYGKREMVRAYRPFV
jgi:tRNA U34 5-methylaminomethyl-2-thiouridine-forming methyltransferase MnmC